MVNCFGGTRKKNTESRDIKNNLARPRRASKNPELNSGKNVVHRTSAMTTNAKNYAHKHKSECAHFQQHTQTHSTLYTHMRMQCTPL